MFFRKKFNVMLSGGRSDQRMIGRLELRVLTAAVLLLGGLTGVIVSWIFGELSLGVGIGEAALVLLILTASDPLHLFEKISEKENEMESPGEGAENNE